MQHRPQVKPKSLTKNVAQLRAQQAVPAGWEGPAFEVPVSDEQGGHGKGEAA